MKPLDNFYLQQESPVKECFLALKSIILSQDKYISNEWKYGMPFFCYKGKMFCYLWLHKKYRQPYIGLVEGKRLHHPELMMENRSRMKIMLLDPDKDLPMDAITRILQDAINLYKTGVVKL